jgi:hypothetical protein
MIASQESVSHLLALDQSGGDIGGRDILTLIENRGFDHIFGGLHYLGLAKSDSFS